MGGISRISVAIALGALSLTAPALAYDSTGTRTEQAQFLTVEEAAAFSKQVERSLAEKGARVGIVFRSGRSRDRLPENVRYTHGAFWVYQDIEREDGSRMQGYVVYNLFHGDGESLPKTKSYLAQDFPLDFAVGSSVDDIAVIVPAPELQRRILQVMASETYEQLHIEDYSLISNAANATFQNCNEFMLDVIAAAAWQTSDYDQIKANLSAHFQPTVIDTNLMERIFAPVADVRLKTADHTGKIETVTYESIAGFLKKFDMLQDTYVIQRDLELTL